MFCFDPVPYTELLLGPFECKLDKGCRLELGVRLVADFDLGVLKLLPGAKFPKAKREKRNYSLIEKTLSKFVVSSK